MDRHRFIGGFRKHVVTKALLQERFDVHMLAALDSNDVSEVHSPPRASNVAHEFGLVEGWIVDLTAIDENWVPWGFSREGMGANAKEKLKTYQPTLVIASSMRTGFSTMLSLNWSRMNEQERDKRMKEVGFHLNSCIES